MQINIETVTARLTIAEIEQDSTLIKIYKDLIATYETFSDFDFKSFLMDPKEGVARMKEYGPVIEDLHSLT